MPAVQEIIGRSVLDPEAFRRDVCLPCQPVVLRGLVADWPAVTAGRSPRALRDYLLAFDNGGRNKARILSVLQTLDRYGEIILENGQVVVNRAA